MNRYNKNLRNQLHVFTELDQQGSWARTATALDVLQITVQSRIDKLETWLNCRLIDRVGGTKIVLTWQGHIFLSYARRALQESHDQQFLEVITEGRQHIQSLKAEPATSSGAGKYEEGRHVVY